MNKGSSRQSRKKRALNPSHVSIDERTIIEMLHFTLDFSQNINFFNFQNNVTGNWKSFLLNDPSFIIAMIASTDISKFKINEENLEYQTGEVNQREKINEVSEKIYRDIVQWATLLNKTNYKGSLLTEIENSIQNSDKKKSDTHNKADENFIDAYEEIYGSMVFIKDQALKQFDQELKSSGHHPHVGLLLAFFKLFINLQQDINLITKKHLDFYFLELLKQQKKEPELHSALVALHLQEGANNPEIQKGDTFEFTFGENQTLSFEAISNAPINNAEIAEIKTLYKSDHYPFGNQFDEEDFTINVLYEKDILTDKIDVLSQGVVEPDDYPATLGEEKSRNIFPGSSVNQSDIGLLVTSPVLILEKGKQNVRIKFKITPASYRKSQKLFDALMSRKMEHQNKGAYSGEKFRQKIISQFYSSAFQIFITDKNGWKQVEFSKTRINPVDSSLDIEIPLSDQKDTLVPFDNNIHDGNFETEWPCIKFILNNDARYYPYKILKDIVIEEIKIEATVSEVTNLTLSNSLGNLDNSIPFTPFGAVPVIGNYLRIQNPLILQKNLSHLEMNINWSGLPQLRNGFDNYYRAYPRKLDNRNFKAVITQYRNSLRSTEKQNLQEVELFEMDGEYLSNEKRITVKTDGYVFSRENLRSKNVLSENSSSLFMVLTSPEIAFGHQIYAQIYAAAALKMSRRKKAPELLPAQPYLPTIDRLEINYANTAREIMLRKLDEKVIDIKLIHLFPFGHVQVYPGSVKSQSFLFPQIEGKGHLMIGLKNVNPAEVVSIGFELVPAVYVHTVINVPEIQWQYLLNNEWKSLHELLLEDNTEGLIRSGIVKIKLPKTIQLNNSRLPKGKFWIRAVSEGKEDVRSRIKNVFVQAVSLTLKTKIDNNIPDFKDKEKNQKFTIEGRKEVVNISGPFAMEINEQLENEDIFYSRISEQLRHKNRAVSNWDVERIVLDKFNQIEKVRVFGRNGHPKELVKGSGLQIVLIPKNKLKDGTRIRSTKVDFSTLNNVKQYIRHFVSPHVKVEVSNPVYEQLKIRCNVKFKDTLKSGYFKSILNNELISYLSPDIKNDFIEKGFDESISKTEILNFIESRPYVEFVTEFSVIQLIEVQNRYKIIDTAKIQKITDLRTISAYAILTSAPEHQIIIIQNKESEKAKISGIGDLSVEADFVISDSDGDYI